MLVGLISDTHIPDHVKQLPERLDKVFHGVDLILHAGDIYVVSVLNELERIAPVLAAEGDDDPGHTVSDRRVEHKHILTLDGVTLWLTHEMIWKWPPLVSGSPPNVIVFGHTHQPALKMDDGVLRVSPGSATFPQYRLELGTVGLLRINSGQAEAEIIQL